MTLNYSTRQEVKVAVVNYGMGNIGSVVKVLKRLNVMHKVTAEQCDLRWADRIILPGVGAFGSAMEKLNELNLVDPITEQVLEKKKPVLGICLGMQLFAKTSVEKKITEGLGFIDADVRKLSADDQHRLPHIGWNTIIKEKKCQLIDDLEDKSFMYFAHDYAVECNDKSNIVCSTIYAKKFPSVICKENIFGVQFHPEKSQRTGAVVMTNFVFGGLV